MLWTRSDLHDSYGRATELPQILRVAGHHSDRSRGCSGNSGQRGIDGVFVTMQVVSALQGNSGIGKVAGDFMDIDARADPGDPADLNARIIGLHQRHDGAHDPDILLRGMFDKQSHKAVLPVQL